MLAAIIIISILVFWAIGYFVALALTLLQVVKNQEPIKEHDISVIKFFAGMSWFWVLLLLFELYDNRHT